MITDNNLIYFAHAGQESFNDEEHLDNYLKYLFSCSKSHKENALTKQNFYLNLNKQSNSLNKYSFVYNSKEKYQKFKTNFEEELYDENELKNDLFYVGFIITIGNRTISNFFAPSLDDSDVLIPCLPSEVIDIMINEYFNGEETLFGKAVKHVIDNIPGQLTEFKNATEQERLFIEKKIHSKLIEKSPTDKILLAISHHDQDQSPYHIHRLIHLT